MADTKIEKIRNFNTAAEQREKERTEKTKTVVDPTSQDTTSREKVKEKSEEKPKTAEELEAERKAIEEQQIRDQQDTIKQLTNATSHIIDNVNERVNPLKQWIASQPTPGGIATVLIFILFFVVAVVPVNAQGQTRLYLFWQTLLNRTHLKYVESGAGASSDFGGGSTSQPAQTLSGASGSFGAPSQQDLAQAARNNGQGVIDITHLNLFGSRED